MIVKEKLLAVIERQKTVDPMADDILEKTFGRREVIADH